MVLAAFVIDWHTVGGSSFIELCTGVNLAFVAWDKFQERLQIISVKGRDLVSQTTTTLLEDESHRGNMARFFLKIHEPVERFVKAAWYAAYTLGCFAVAAGFLMLYFNWSCKWDWLLISPIFAYFAVCSIYYVAFSLVCKGACSVVNIAVGGNRAAVEKLKQAANESNPNDW